MELSHLQAAVKLAETCNYSRAAEQLFITQPALSQQISSLEAELGLQLFARTTRKVSLTPAGQEFVRHARRVLEEMEGLSQSMALYRREMFGSLSIGLLSTLSHLNLPAYISGFQSVYPNIRIEIQIAFSDMILSRLLSHQIDVAITNIHVAEDGPSDPRLNVRVFLEDVVTVLANRRRAIARKEFLTLEDLAGEPVVVNEKVTSIRQRMDSIYASSGLLPHIVCTCPDMESLIAMVRADMGVCFLSSAVAHQYVRDGELVCIPLRPAYCTQTAMVTLKSHREESMALHLFEDYFYGIIH